VRALQKVSQLHDRKFTRRNYYFCEIFTSIIFVLHFALRLMFTNTDPSMKNDKVFDIAHTVLITVNLVVVFISLAMSLTEFEDSFQSAR